MSYIFIIFSAWYNLDDYNVLLYIGLLTQLSYLIYVGFLNSSMTISLPHLETKSQQPKSQGTQTTQAMNYLKQVRKIDQSSGEEKRKRERSVEAVTQPPTVRISGGSSIWEKANEKEIDLKFVSNLRKSEWVRARDRWRRHRGGIGEGLNVFNGWGY